VIRRAAILIVALGVLPAGCGVRDQGSSGRSAGPPRVSAPATLAPDGSVPWVDEPGTQREFAARLPQRRRVDPGGEACTADQLTARLERWAPKLLHDDEGNLVGNAGLLAMIDVRNTSGATCLLRGEAPVTLRVDGKRLSLIYVHRVNAAARRQTTSVRPGARATLRLDWSSPFCGDARGDQSLEIELPQSGGTVRARVAHPAQPICPGNVEPHRGSVLAAGVFDEPPRPAQASSPLNRLRVSIHARRPPAAARRMRYETVLRNPTDDPIALRPCPGYRQERFSPATAAHDQPLNDGQVFRLNCRPVHAVPAHGEVRFGMVVWLPKALRAGRRFSVTWELLGPGVDASESLRGGFTVTVR
jgi:hypothetical protein